MDPKTSKCQKMTHPKKRQKTNRQQVVKSTKMVSKWDEVFVAETLPKSCKFTNSQKWNPGTSRDPKGIQQVSKRHPKGDQKASKRRPHLYKVNPTGIKNLKSQCKKMQRTLHPIRASQLQQNHKAVSMSTLHTGVQV